MNFLTAPLAEIKPLAAAAVAGDADAQQYFVGLFTGDDPCMLCDSPVGPGRRVCMLPDPAPGSASMAILMPICAACNSLPQETRRVRELALARRMWPGRRWRTTKRDNDPSYRRGSRVKARRGKPE